MAGEQTLIVGIEDMATAGVVAVEAAHVAQTHDTAIIVLLHVLDPHSIVTGVAAASGYPLPMGESTEEGEAVLALAEQALRAEFTAIGRPVPSIRRIVAEGPVGAAIAHIIKEYSVGGIVLGARRPHALGRLIHPDVRAHLATHTGAPIHVAPLQAS